MALQSCFGFEINDVFWKHRSQLKKKKKKNEREKHQVLPPGYFPRSESGEVLKLRSDLK